MAYMIISNIINIFKAINKHHFEPNLLQSSVGTDGLLVPPSIQTFFADWPLCKFYWNPNGLLLFMFFNILLSFLQKKNRTSFSYSNFWISPPIYNTFKIGYLSKKFIRTTVSFLVMTSIIINHNQVQRDFRPTSTTHNTMSFHNIWSQVTNLIENYTKPKSSQSNSSISSWSEDPPTKEFVTRSSSIADDATTLCPTIPSSIKSQPLLRRSSSITSISDISFMGGGMEDAARGAEGYPTEINTNETATNRNNTNMQLPTTTTANNPQAEMIALFRSMIDEVKASNEAIQAKNQAQIDELSKKITARPPVQHVQVSSGSNTKSIESDTRLSFASAAASKSNANEKAQSHSADSKPEAIRNISIAQVTPAKVLNAHAQEFRVSSLAKRSLADESFSGTKVSIPTKANMGYSSKGQLLVRAFSFMGDIEKVTKGEDFDFRYEIVAESLASAAKIIDPQVQIVIVSCKEQMNNNKSTNPNDNKTTAQLVLGLRSEYHMDAETKVRRLKNLVQEVNMKNTVKELENWPSYVKAFQFEINAVNSEDMLVWGFLQDFDASWITRGDHKAHDFLCQQIIDKAMNPFGEGNMPEPIDTILGRWDNLGVFQYTSSHTKIDNKFGKQIALVRAANEEGEAAATALYDCIQDDVFCILGELKVSIVLMPTEPGQRKIKQLNTKQNFAKQSIEANQKLINNYHCMTISGLTNAVFNDTMINEILVNCTDSIAVIPRLEKTKNGDIGSAVTIVSNNTAHSRTKKAARVKATLAETVKNIFPIEIPDNEDDEDDEYNDFITVKRNNNNAIRIKKPQGKGSELEAKISAISKVLAQDMDADTRYYAMMFTRGGRAGVGVDKGWHGPGKARYLTQGVSGAIVEGFDTEAEAWERFTRSYPNITNYEELQAFRASIPYNETNLWPTWPEFDGERFHRQGAVAYTFVEFCDKKMMENRVQATYRITGSAEGVIENRKQMYEENWFVNINKRQAAAVAAAAAAARESEAAISKKSVPNTAPPPGLEKLRVSDSFDANEMNNKGDTEIIDVSGNDYENSDYPNSQDIEMQGFLPITERDITEGEIVEGQSKRRKVPVNNDDAAEIAADNLPLLDKDMESVAGTEVAKVDQEVPWIIDFYTVVFAIPFMAAIRDIADHLNEFKFGFGKQNKISRCRCFLFPECLAATVTCPSISVAKELRKFLATQHLFNKFSLDSGLITRETDLKQLCTFEDENSAFFKHQEALAEEPLMQHVKKHIPKRHVESLHSNLTIDRNAEQIYELYKCEWKKREGEGVDIYYDNKPIWIPHREFIVQCEDNDKELKLARTKFTLVHFTELDFQDELSEHSL